MFPYRQKPSKRRSIVYFLDSFSIHDVRAWKLAKDKFLKYHWDYYSTLAYQRSKIEDELRKSLIGATEKNFRFERWQRSLRYVYSQEPLSPEGSLKDPGGRFNIGDINAAQYPPFPALYLAEEKNTALQEALCQSIVPGKEEEALEFALASPDSMTNVSMSGQLDAIIDLTKPERLQEFVDLIKDFKIPSHLIRTAREMKIPPPELLRTVPKLVENLLTSDWRCSPMHVDVPAAPQIFGQIVCMSGIEGILYPSKFDGKKCLAVFPQNFVGGDSFVQIDDPAPPKVCCRLDAKNVREMNYCTP